jgi:predicted TIM-barrel fold metal-dependent hydrolase
VKSVHTAEQGQGGADNLVVVSSDTHIGPLLSTLRDYCPAAYLEAYDDFVAEDARLRAPVAGDDDALGRLGGQADEAAVAKWMRNRQTAGHHDMAARLRDMDNDGIAAELIFHGSQNEEPFPFQLPPDAIGGTTTPFTFEGLDKELAGVGIRMYNRWLADAVSDQPERHVGLAHIPAWDVQASIEEITWARRAGLRGVNFPAFRPGMSPLQDDEWESFWAASAALEMPLAGHVGAGDASFMPPAEFAPLRCIESMFFTKRTIWSLVVHGVFERHPTLNLVIVEVPGIWWTALMNEMDSLKHLMPPMSKSPSEYCATNVFHGATFMSRAEAEHAVEQGYDGNILWGSDYPHLEGTWQFDSDEQEEPQTHLALRYTFAGLPEPAVEGMLGSNAVKVFGLDGDYLQKVANQITAPTIDEVETRLDPADIPAEHGLYAFRTFGPWS